MNRFRSILTMVVGLALAAGSASADFRKAESSPRVVDGVTLGPSPALPTPAETTVVKARRHPHARISGITPSEKVIGEQVRSYLQSNPSELGVKSTPPLRLDYVHLVPG